MLVNGVGLPVPGPLEVPGRPPAPLIESEPAPLQGRPVSGLVPVTPAALLVPGSVPGLIGDTGGSGISGRLKALNGFCASTSGAAPDFSRAKRCIKSLCVAAVAPARGHKCAPARRKTAASVIRMACFCCIARSFAALAAATPKIYCKLDRSAMNAQRRPPARQYLALSARSTQLGHASATELRQDFPRQREGVQGGNDDPADRYHDERPARRRAEEQVSAMRRMADGAGLVRISQRAPGAAHLVVRGLRLRLRDRRLLRRSGVNPFSLPLVPAKTGTQLFQALDSRFRGNARIWRARHGQRCGG